jgi:hypothetical protein
MGEPEKRADLFLPKGTLRPAARFALDCLLMRLKPSEAIITASSALGRGGPLLFSLMKKVTKKSSHPGCFCHTRPLPCKSGKTEVPGPFAPYFGTRPPPQAKLPMPFPTHKATTFYRLSPEAPRLTVSGHNQH